MFKQWYKHGMVFMGLLAIASNVTAGAANQVTEYKLENGLKLLVQEDHRAPVADFQIWYRVGSSYELPGQTGLSHLLEHLMFKGTTKYPNDSFSKIIAAQGGNQNAMTSADYTAYYQSLESSRIATSFELEADRMQNLTLTENDFATELKVVQEERRSRVDDNPQSLLYEQLRATAFVASPYHHPVIGWMGDLQNLTLADAKNWYSKWYGPNNATIVIAGDVEPKQMYALAQKYFGEIKTIDLPKHKPITQLRPIAQKRVVAHLPARLPYLMMTYHTPTLTTLDAKQQWKSYALFMLASILSGNDSARLDKTLIRQNKLAAAISVYYQLDSRLDDLFMVAATPSAKVSSEALEQAITKELENLQQTLVSEEELARARQSVIAEQVFEKDQVHAQAMGLGVLASVNLPWQLEREFVENIKNVTPKQIREVAREFLQTDKMVVGVLNPKLNDNEA